MSWLKDLDAAIQGRLEAVTAGGKRMLRTVGPLRAQGRSPVPGEMASADKPALFYAIERIGGDAEGVLARVQALLIGENLRSAAAAWRGGSDGPGLYEVAESAARAMAAPDLAGTAGAWLTLQRLVYADARVIALQQEYEVLPTGQRLLVDGQDVLGARSSMGIKQSEATAGVILAGTLWAPDETSLARIEQALDALLADQRSRQVRVGTDWSWSGVTLSDWLRMGGRMSRPILGLQGQAIQIEFAPYEE